ncbi:DUF1853 family protein [Salinivibrio sp. ML290]|uniref:DUF1853 family protein n=1 Tax=Salinivibrio sp. ML290 TaxID=1909468 RepID=UPI00098887EF|nr:DUF1853 family protein [Salinivibrio sp. ML290]OOE77008.1 hypothetical protein BZG23_01335 [Salinivibrio sp. ML290]
MSDTDPLFSNQDQINADFSWLQNQFSLLSDKHFPVVPHHLWQHKLLPSPSPYKGPKRIGFYYQWLLTQLIDCHPHLGLEAEEIQINEGGKTRGAIDFLVRYQGQLEHWEVAVKFYLAHDNRWLGPNAKDALDIKVARMLDHQLALSSHPSFCQQYPHWQPSEKRLMVQGRLYRHYHHGEQPLPEWPPVNHDSIGGWWCWPDALPTDREFAVLARDQWLSLPAFADLPKLERASLDELSRTCHLLDDSLTPWFVVPRDWPETIPALPALK